MEKENGMTKRGSKESGIIRNSREEKLTEAIYHRSTRDIVFLIINYLILSICFIFVVGQFCNIFPENPCYTYLALTSSLAVILLIFLINYKKRVYIARLEDFSEVEALLIEAETVEKRLPNKPEGFEKKEAEIKKEATRLRALGEIKWIDYQILSLNVMLVDFLKFEDLKARARSSLTDLAEYCHNTADRFERAHSILKCKRANIR